MRYYFYDGKIKIFSFFFFFFKTVFLKFFYYADFGHTNEKMCKPLTVFEFDFELQNFHTKNCVKYLKLKFKLFLTFF
jgi:hypothetical protein